MNLKKLCMIFSYIGIIISVSVILQKIKFIVIPITWIVAIFSKDIVPLVPKSVIA